MWALGVLLYELVAGRRPFEGDTREAWMEAVLNAAPTAPSRIALTRTRTQDAPTSPISPREARRLRGDLDAICLQALRREPEARYASAHEMAADLRRYLADEPVSARRPSALYRARRFVRRNRAATAVGALSLALLMAGTAAYTLRVSAERDRANQEATKAARVSQFFVDTFGDASPFTAPVDSITVLAVLDNSVAKIDSALSGEPDVQGQLLGMIGDVYLTLGRFEEAERALSRSLVYDREAYGEDDPRLGIGLTRLGRLELFRGLPVASDSLLTLALDAFGDPAALAPRLREEAAIARLSRGSAHHWQNDLDAAVADFELALGVLDGLGQSASVHRLNALNGYGWVLEARGDRERALEIAREVAAEVRRQAPDNTLRIAVAQQGVGRALRGMDRDAEAEAVMREVVAAREAAQGGNNVEVAGDRVTLALVLLAQGKTTSADSVLNLADPVLEAHYGPDKPMLGTVRQNRAELAVARGDLAGAEREYRRTIALFETGGEPFVRRHRRATLELAETLDLAGRPEEALGLIRERYALDSTLAPFGRVVGGSLLAQTGEAARGVEMAREAAREIAETNGEASWRTARARLHLGRALRAAGRESEATPLISASRRTLREIRGARTALVTATG